MLLCCGISRAMWDRSVLPGRDDIPDLFVMYRAALIFLFSFKFTCSYVYF